MKPNRFAQSAASSDLGEQGSSARDLPALLEACTWPSEAFWRMFELRALRRHEFLPPIVELGCGDGAFTELLGLPIHEAVDLNPRAVKRAQRRGDIYRSVRQMDIRDLKDERQRFATVFANSVLEHVDGVEDALAVCHELLAPGGSLVTTVPLIDMNEHLAIRSKWYAKMRARQLKHRNLWSLDQWCEALREVGFESVSSVPYLDASACRRWDLLDVVGSFGFGRYRVSSALRRAVSVILPRRAKARTKHLLATSIGHQFQRSVVHSAQPCAALLVATKGGA